jgi:hypothetical protein
LLGYVEVTTVDAPAAEEAEKNPVYNAINASKNPAGSILRYKLVRAGKDSPALKPLVADVERKLHRSKHRSNFWFRTARPA